MSPEEARIIRDVFDRVRSMGSTDDADAHAFVNDELRCDPAAALGLVQAIVALDGERQALSQRVAELERTAQTPRTSGPIFGRPASPWGQATQPQPQPEPGYGQPSYQRDPTPSPWQRSAPPAPPVPPVPPQPQARSGGGLFSTILGAATGVAAGYAGYEAMKSIFGGEQHAQGDGSPALPEWTSRDESDDNAFFGGSDGGGDSA